MNSLSLVLCLLCIIVVTVNGFQSFSNKLISHSVNSYSLHKLTPSVRVFNKIEPTSDDIDETVRKYGVEAGLLKAAESKDSKEKASDLLKKYGIAYLATSITLAIISYAICFVLVSTGVDVSALLEKVGIKATESAANVGTAGIAYAIHKAASPIRFPPTVALTPLVANWLGRKPDETVDV